MQQSLIDFVQQSPEACKVHDKAKWMSLFDDYHIVEDPVGSTPHVGGVYSAKDGIRGNGALSRFFDTFIQPNQISFDVKQDIVCGLHVIRDLNINIQMSDKIRVSVPMHLLYVLREKDDGYRIARLAAHWEFLPMIKQLLGKGRDCLQVVTGLSVRMLKLQGLAGTLGFSGAAWNIGKKGKLAVGQFLAALNMKDLSGLMNTVCNDEIAIHLPYGRTPVVPSTLFDQINFNQLTYNKMIVAGDTVSISFSLDGKKEGVGIFEFDRKNKKISEVRFYYQA